MKVLFFFLSILFIISSCEREDWQSEHPQPASSTDKLPFNITGQHGSYLIKLDGKSRETNKVAAMLQAVNHYDAALSFNDLPGDDKQVTLLAMVKDSLNDITVLGDAVDFASGKYDAKMIREIRHNRQGVILIAKNGTDEEQKECMLQLFGIYVGKGYYKVCFPYEQRYYFYSEDDMDALKKLCGPGNLRAAGTAPPPADETTDRALRALKRIYVSNRFYVYTNDYKYKMTGYEPLHEYVATVHNYTALPDLDYAAVIDREWTVDAYNLRIYAPTNGCNMLAVYTSGGNGFANRLGSSTVFLNNAPKNEVWALIWGLRNKAYSNIRIFDSGHSLLNLKLVDFAPGLPESESTITHSQSRSVGFNLGVCPELHGEYGWEKSITYQLKEMTRSVQKDLRDSEMQYSWKWYPETLFKGSKAMKANGMIDGAAMISPAWYKILYDSPHPIPDNLFCDYNEDPLFNQNLLNYQQECALTMKTNGASAGVVGIDIEDGVTLQRGGAWFNSWGTPSLHPLPSTSGIACDATLDAGKTTTVWIDYNNW